jgi:hypothetical protein
MIRASTSAIGTRHSSGSPGPFSHTSITQTYGFSSTVQPINAVASPENDPSNPRTTGTELIDDTLDLQASPTSPPATRHETSSPSSSSA